MDYCDIIHYGRAAAEAIPVPFAFEVREMKIEKKYSLKIKGGGLQNLKVATITDIITEQVGIVCKKVKLVASENFAVVDFNSEEERQQFVDTYKSAERLSECDCEIMIRRAKSSRNEDDDLVPLRMKATLSRSSLKFWKEASGLNDKLIPRFLPSLALGTTPLAFLPYDEQVVLKADYACDILAVALRSVAKTNYKGFKPFMDKQLRRTLNMCTFLSDTPYIVPTAEYFHPIECSLDNIEGGLHPLSYKAGLLPMRFGGCLPAPENSRSQYRNKVDLSFGEFEDGSTGFGFMNAGKVYPCHFSQIIDPSFVFYAELINNWLGKFTPQPAKYNPAGKSGCMSNLVMHKYDQGIAIMFSLDLAEISDIPAFDEALLSFFTVDVPESILGLAAVGYDDVCRDSDVFVMHKPHFPELTKSLFGFPFTVDPRSFFQVNVKASELLFDSVMSLIVTKDKPTTILDICCGSGVVGLLLASRLYESDPEKIHAVFGVDIDPHAIKTCEINKTKFPFGDKCQYLAAPCESVKGRVLQSIAGNSDIVAIIDPPRAGVGAKLVKAIRQLPIDKLIYICCGPDSLKNVLPNFARAKSNSYQGAPFFPTQVYCVDMFPHTTHFETVLVLERHKPNWDINRQILIDNLDSVMEKVPEQVQREKVPWYTTLNHDSTGFDAFEIKSE
ncbi:hypothetical protein PCE1_003622 [Barthelona sp. PCE]